MPTLVQPPEVPNQKKPPASSVSPAASNVMTPDNLSILSFLMGAGQTPPPSSTTTTPPPAKADNRTLFEKFFGTDLTSVTFVIVGVIIIMVALTVFFAQASKAAAPYVVSAASSAAKLAAV